MARIGGLAVEDGRISNGAAGDGGRVTHIEGVPKGADEVDRDGETGVSGIAKGHMATAVDAQGHGAGARRSEEDDRE